MANHRKVGPYRLEGKTLHNRQLLSCASIIICGICTKCLSESLILLNMLNLRIVNFLGIPLSISSMNSVEMILHIGCRIVVLEVLLNIHCGTSSY